jgi:hypothetical protein
VCRFWFSAAIFPELAALGPALVAQMLYSIRSERLLMEEIKYSILLRCSWD